LELPRFSDRVAPVTGKQIDMTGTEHTHENYRREEPSQGGSDRAFGLTFAVVAACVAAWSWWQNGDFALFWLLGSAAFLGAALAWPRVLAPLNRIWYRFGLVLHRVVNPVVMAVLFFAVVTPTGFLMRARGFDPLRLKWDAGARSYWISRAPSGPAPKTMHRQF
jgi:hypothetical protein